MEFMEDCASRIYGRVQVTTDAHKPYLKAVEGAFGIELITQCCTRFTVHRQMKSNAGIHRQRALALI